MATTGRPTGENSYLNYLEWVNRDRKKETRITCECGKTLYEKKLVNHQKSKLHRELMERKRVHYEMLEKKKAKEEANKEVEDFQKKLESLGFTPQQIEFLHSMNNKV